MAVQLVVTSPFGDYAAGDRITDADLVEQHSDSPNVVRVTPPPAPPPTEEELQERAEALAALERLKAKLGSAADGEGLARILGEAPQAADSEAQLRSSASETAQPFARPSEKQEG